MRFAPRTWLPLAVVAAASLAPAQGPASTDALAALLGRLDACFARGDVTGLVATFRPDHPGTHAVLRRQLERLAAIEPRPQLRSRVLTAPRRIADRTVVRVRHELRFAAPEHTLQLDTMMAVAAAADGALVPTLAVEIPAQWSCVRGDLFRCPPCNYRIGGVDGWICVPARPERAQALEAATFYLIGTDVACDISVRIDAAAPAAASVVRDLGAAVARLDADAALGPVEAWTPPAHAGEDGPFAGARLDVALPGDFAGRGGVARLFVVTLGGLQHLLLVRGSNAALQGRARDVDALLASYGMLQTDVDLALAAAEPLHHHTGGKLTGGRYENDRYGFRVDGPDGWRAEQRCGGAALRVVWSSAAGSRLWLTGYAVPHGGEAWHEAAADRWLGELLARADLVASDDGDTTWSVPAGCSAQVRTLVCAPRRAASPGTPRERTIRALLRDELLLVADAYAANADDAAAMDRTIDALLQQ